MRNIDAALQLKEAWNSRYDKEYDTLLKVYKEQGYVIKRNDKTGEHIVEKAQDFSCFKGTPFESFFN